MDINTASATTAPHTVDGPGPSAGGAPASYVSAVAGRLGLVPRAPARAPRRVARRTARSRDVARPALSPRRLREEARALRHTRRVKRLRILLPTLSALMVAALVVAAVLPKLVPLSALAGLSLTADGLVMNEPRLAGSLGEGRRYEVVAARAIQSLLSPANLSLEGLHASLDLGEDGAVTIDGQEAAYNTDTEILTLSQGVEIASTDGNRARLNDAVVFLKEGRVEGDGGVTITSPRGTIRAGAINITDGGSVIRLSGGVAITIHPES